MLSAMLHDSANTAVTCEAAELGVYAGTVAHTGSFAASESGQDPTAQLELVAAGECLQDAAESAGWMLRQYKQTGDQFVGTLNGSFSAVLIDRVRGRALLFNDRYGTERLYVCETDDGAYLASEAKALLQVLPETRSFDDEGVAEFLTFGCPLEGRTLFSGIRTLKGGSLWIFEGGRCRKRQYFVPAEWEQQSSLSTTGFQAAFEETFKRAIVRYVRAEPRLGISLTGGLDTRMIMACLPTLTPDPICYTFAGREGRTLDARVAAQVASVCGLEHQVLRIGSDFFSQFASQVDRTVYATDACAGVLGAHEIYLNAQARQLAPIRLTGNFGSEVLRGMSTFKPLGLHPELLADDFRARADRAARPHRHETPHPVTFAAFREIPTNLFGTMAAARSQLTFRTPYLDNDLVALTYRAPADARESAASALRLVRNANPRLGDIATDRAIRSGGHWLGNMGLRLIAESTFKLDYLYFEALPKPLLPFDRIIGALQRVRLLGRHKYLPYRVWFRNELASYVEAALTDPGAHRLPYFNRSFLERVSRDHIQGHRNFVREINAAITLVTAERLLLRPNTFPSTATDTAVERHIPKVLAG